LAPVALCRIDGHGTKTCVFGDFAQEVYLSECYMVNKPRDLITKSQDLRIILKEVSQAIEIIVIFIYLRQ
jgi:hypothetical protein